MTSIQSRLAELITEHYVFPDVAEQIVARIDPVRTGSAAESDHERLAAALTEQIQSVNNDRHLRVRYRASGAIEAPVDWAAHYAAETVRYSGGVRTVRRIDEHTGLLDIAPYTPPVDLAEPYLRAAFTLLSGVDRLVIDVRDGRGGTPETIAFICGYLLGDEPVHLQDIVERSGSARQFWTSPAAGRLRGSVAICVLTSEGTFSGCEELAYNLQALGRATVVGRRTGGGAHPVNVFTLTDRLEVTVPVARSVNAVTGTNWEGTGVLPDIDCDAGSALDRALAHLG